ncbi:hypothetical protein trd_0915 [Thermomicrobium roseum DSM 5159]|uniref:Uncharacterized protein n=1 Tax=Thermomicrobium roseum (strain ATCC 27502 / DSM 5159 / P-2) TaxID=309801 RepID=B9KZS1_THERP|nr:hypothetical protein trd_0915 [Thermomicrobium roseum DSM 5159]
MTVSKPGSLGTERVASWRFSGGTNYLPGGSPLDLDRGLLCPTMLPAFWTQAGQPGGQLTF